MVPARHAPDRGGGRGRGGSQGHVLTRRAWSLLLVLAAIWGSSYLFIKIGVRELSPAMIAFLRVGLGALVVVPLAWSKGAFAGIGRHWRMLALVAVIQAALPFFLIAEGEREIPSALAGILVASAPLFSALLAFFYDPEERTGGLRAVGVLLGLVGVALLLGVDLGGAEVVGGLLVVLASLGYAVGGLLVKQRLHTVQPLGIAAAVLAISTVATAPFALTTAPASFPGAGPIAATIVLGVLGTGVAFAIFYTLIADVGPSRTFVVTYLAPVFAVVYGATLLGEQIAVATLGGLALILAGSWLAAEGRMPWRPRPRGGPILDEGPETLVAATRRSD